SSHHPAIAAGARNSPAWQCAEGQPCQERGDNRCSRTRESYRLPAHRASSPLETEGTEDGWRRVRRSPAAARRNLPSAKGPVQEQPALLHPFAQRMPWTLPPERIGASPALAAAAPRCPQRHNPHVPCYLGQHLHHGTPDYTGTTELSPP